MKIHALYIMTLFTASCSFAAKTEQTFSISADSSSFIYRCGDEATFTITALNSSGLHASNGTITVEMDNFGPKVYSRKTVDLAQGNPFTVKGTMREPGFLRLTVSGTGFRKTMYSVGYEPERLLKGSPTPPDFERFWHEAVRRLDKTVPADPRLTLIKERSTGAFNFWRISFATSGDSRAHGYLSIPKDASASKKYPVRVQVPGAGKGSWTNNMSGVPDAICMLMTVHAFEPPFDLAELRKCHDALSVELKRKYGTPYYDLAGIAISREEYYFYKALLGINRAVNWLASRSEADLSNFTYSGTSQGGGFGLYLLGLNRHFTRGVLYVPALADTMGYLKGRRSGWPRLIEQQTEGNKAAAERNAPYFDGANFAPYITCPVRVIVGLADVTCPPASVYAAYNAIASKDKQIILGVGMTHSCFPKFYEKFGKWQQRKSTNK